MSVFILERMFCKWFRCKRKIHGVLCLCTCEKPDAIYITPCSCRLLCKQKGRRTCVRNGLFVWLDL